MTTRTSKSGSQYDQVMIYPILKHYSFSLNNFFVGKIAGDPTVNQLRCLKYTPNGEISFKLNFDDEYKPLPQRRSSSTITNLEPKRMYWERLTISQSKYKHLQDLKALIPSDTHAFYDNIPFHADPPKSKK